jgi:hypothetical protein
LLFAGQQAWAQEPNKDLYSPKNSKAFANYLLLAQDYNLATQELERLHFMHPQNDTLQWQLIRAYRLAGEYEKGVQRFRDFYYNFPPQAPVNITQEYYATLLRLQNFGLAQQLVNRYTGFKSPFKEKQQAGILLQQGQYDSTAALISHYGITDPVLLSLSKRSKNLPRKSPFLSGTLSALVPGLGKVYTGNWQDGLIAFVFVGANAFGAYRGFRAQGVNSFYGWFFTATGTAFYASNIYGSVKAARVYNNRYKNNFTQDVERYLFRAVD